MEIYSRLDSGYSTSTAKVAPSSKNAPDLAHMKYADQQLSDIRQRTQEDKVNISSQALSKFQQEQNASTSNKSVKDDINDRAITDIKKQIEALKQELNKVKYDRSEQAQREKKMLQYQINALNASLLDLLGKKLNAL